VSPKQNASIHRGKKKKQLSLQKIFQQETREEPRKGRGTEKLPRTLGINNQGRTTGRSDMATTNEKRAQEWSKTSENHWQQTLPERRVLPIRRVGEEWRRDAKENLRLSGGGRGETSPNSKVKKKRRARRSLLQALFQEELSQRNCANKDAKGERSRVEVSKRR